MTLPGNRKLGWINNCDPNALLVESSGKHTSPGAYGQLVRDMLAPGMKLLAQEVGTPDTVNYRTKVATTLDKHAVEVSLKVWADVWGPRGGASKERVREGAQHEVDALRRLMEAGTDPLSITIEECRRQGVVIVASYRMNSEDAYMHTYAQSDFGREHPEWRIPLTKEERQSSIDAGDDPPFEFIGCLDPAIPEVFDYRMAIFREVAENYDIDGIQFNFKRWYHMISDPLKNHPILTRMVAETRRMLDEVARKKGRERMILGVRVGGALDTPPSKEAFPGMRRPHANPSCKDQGTDVKTWIAQGYVDYVCPALFAPRLPGLPHTREFAALASGTDVGIYPTLGYGGAAWMGDSENPVFDSLDVRRRHRDEIVRAALQCYEEGADGISTYNRVVGDPDSPSGKKQEYTKEYRHGVFCEGYSRVCMQVDRELADPRALKDLLEADPPTAGFE